MMDEIKKEIEWIKYVLNRGVDELDGRELDDETKQEVMEALEDVEDEAANFESRMIEINARIEDAYNRAATKENA